MGVNTELDHISSRGAALNDVFQTLHEAGGATAARVVSTALGRLLSIETEVHDPGKADSWGKSHLSTIRKGVFVVLIGSWEKLHTGRWGEVQFIWRELYALCALIYAELGLLAASSKKRSLKRPSLLHSLTMLDNASMLGSHLFRTEIDIRIAELQNSLPRISFKECCDDHPHLRLSKPTTLCLKRRWMSRGNYTSWQLGTKCGDLAGKCHLVIAGRKIRPLPWGSFAIGTHPRRKPVQNICSASSFHTFIQHVYIKHVCHGVPALLSGLSSRWNAIRSWQSPRYLLDIFGSRTVPIEFGKHYLNSEWSQERMVLSDFLQYHLRPEPPDASMVGEAEGSKRSGCKLKSVHPSQMVEKLRAWDFSQQPGSKIGYVAQHSLFEQIPMLLKDFDVPVYCTLYGDSINRSSVDEHLKAILAWLGPPGTISPLHTDPHHNILAQVVGYKYVRLYPKSQILAKHVFKDPKMNNSSGVDLNLPMTMFKAAYEDCVHLPHVDFILGPGDALYLPSDHWHYVQSLTSSISISFWW